MNEQQRKKRLFNRILLVCGASAVLYYLGYMMFTKRTARHYFIPSNYNGWVTIKYDKKGAPALPFKSGAYQIYINDSGYAITSTPLEQGWAKDEFFRISDHDIKPIPLEVKSDSVKARFIHDRRDENLHYGIELEKLPVNIDTTLWEGSRIYRKGIRVEIKQGRKLLEHFYLTEKPMPYFFKHDSMPPERKIW